MRILVLSFYFEPDLCAGSFRTTALIRQLADIVPSGAHIDVVTTLPNRYKTFSVEVPQHESRSFGSIYRVALPGHNSGMLDQSKAFLSFAKGVWCYVRSREYDLVFATSSRLLTAALGAVIAKKVHALLYLDVRDIFVDTVKDVLPRSLARFARPAFSLLEKWTFSSAQHINLVSRGFESYFSKRYPRAQLSFFTNGIDDEFLDFSVDESVRVPSESGIITIVYAGNIGEGQGLHRVLPEFAKQLESEVRFLIVGDGGRKRALEQALQEKSVSNVVLLPPMGRNDLLKLYRQADILFLHLNDYAAFHKVLPSKLFEYAATGKPILAGVGGYAAQFVNAEISNARVFSPCNVFEAINAFRGLSLAANKRQTFVQKYARVNIMRNLAKDIIDLLDSKEPVT